MRAFVVSGPESAGNRLVASILIKAGCVGDATSDVSGRWQRTLPRGVDNAVLIRSLPHGGEWPPLAMTAKRLLLRGYRKVELVAVVRSAYPNVLSQVKAGHATSVDDAVRRVGGAWAHLCEEVSIIGKMGLHGVYLHMCTYEGLVHHPVHGPDMLLVGLGLPKVGGGPFEVEGEARPVIDENLKHYEQEVAPC